MLGGLASILLPCIASGYALSSMKVVLHYMPETIGRNTYFRILLVGFAWVSLWLGVAAFVDWRFLGNSYPGELWERWLAFFGDGQEGGSQIIHWKVLLTGILATLLTVALHGLESLVFLEPSKNRRIADSCGRISGIPRPRETLAKPAGLPFQPPDAFALGG